MKGEQEPYPESRKLEAREDDFELLKEFTDWLEFQGIGFDIPALPTNLIYRFLGINRKALEQEQRAQFQQFRERIAGNGDLDGDRSICPDVCPRCKGDFESTGGKPAFAPWICQKCACELYSPPCPGTNSGNHIFRPDK